MTPAELRRAAEMVVGWHETCGGCGNPYRGTSHNVSDDTIALADHVLSTVREDDGEEITIPFAESIGAPPAKIRYENNRRVWVYTFEDERVTIRSRGQLRRLLEGLGVDNGK